GAGDPRLELSDKQWPLFKRQPVPGARDLLELDRRKTRESLLFALKILATPNQRALSAQHEDRHPAARELLDPSTHRNQPRCRDRLDQRGVIERKVDGPIRVANGNSHKILRDRRIRTALVHEGPCFLARGKAVGKDADKIAEILAEAPAGLPRKT